MGGGTKETSFAITRVGAEAKYICHRNSCVWASRGVLNLSGAARALPGVKPKPKPKEFLHPTQPLSDANKKYLLEMYELSEEVLAAYRVCETEAHQMLVMPTYNDKGVQQGHMMKKGVFPAGSKAYTYHGLESDGMSWYNVKPTYTIPKDKLAGAHMKKPFFDDALVIVEDTLSAMKANAFIPAIALLGTSMSAEQAQKIATMKFKVVLLALDADASAKAVRLATRYRTVLPMRVVLLKKDIKDMTYAEVATLLSTHYN
jgi:hypothetical protein